MDTLKREIYMEAERLLKEPRKYALCTCLKIATERLTGYKPRSGELEEFFPEFAALADGKEWGPEGCTTVYACGEGCPLGAYWWKPRWLAPRIRLVRTLLGDIR